LFLFLSSSILYSLPDNSPPNRNSVSEENYYHYFNQGENSRLQGNYKESIQLFQKAHSLSRKSDDKEAEVESLLKLGVLYWNVAKLDESIESYREALNLAEKAEIQKKIQEILNSIRIYEFYQTGKDFLNEGQYQQSIDNFEKAIALAKERKSEEHELKCLRVMSITYLESDDIEKFFSLNKEALEMADRLNHKKEEGRCLFNIGYYYGAIDDYSQALIYYEEALRIARIVKDSDDESECLTNISDIYIQLGSYEKALEYLRAVLRIDKEKLKEESYVESYVAMDLNNIGVTYQKKAHHSGNKDDLYNALINYKESLKIARKIDDIETEIKALNNIGRVYIDLERHPDALKHFKLALKKAERIQDAEETANILTNIGIVYSRQEDYEQAINYCQRAIDTASLTGKENLLWEAHFEIANAYMKQGDFQKSLKNYKNSISHLENLRSKIQLEELKATYLGTDKRIETYQNIVDLLYKFSRHDPEELHGIEAFHFLERAKARAFLDRLEVSQINISQGVDKEMLHQEDDLMNEISRLNSELFKPGLSEGHIKTVQDKLKQCEEKLENIKRKIRVSSLAYANLKYPQIISLEQTQEFLLDPQTAFFEYSLGKKNSYVFVITKRKLKIFPLPPETQIKSQVKEYLKAVVDRDNQNFRLGHELFKTLVSPGLDEKIKKIIFIPDDILHYLPFETLLSQENNNRWLIKDYKIAYAPSISSLREIIEHKRLRKRKPRKDVLAFGDPYFGPYEEEKTGEDALTDLSATASFHFFRLKYSGLEIERIAALFKKARIDIFTRKEATEVWLKKLNLQEYKILHFATHCIIDDKNPPRSSIIFSVGGASTEDEILQMREVFNLKLDSDLVTLSSCQTGLGQLIKGEGIVGLSRAFFYAGASSALISLWAVHDEATSQFMERYYFHLRSSNSIMDALQKAKIEMIDSDVLSHPYYWAGFVVTGSADKIIYPSNIRNLIFLIIFLFLLAAGITSFIILRKRIKSSSKVFCSS